MNIFQKISLFQEYYDCSCISTPHDQPHQAVSDFCSVQLCSGAIVVLVVLFFAVGTVYVTLTMSLSATQRCWICFIHHFLTLYLLWFLRPNKVFRFKPHRVIFDCQNKQFANSRAKILMAGTSENEIDTFPKLNKKSYSKIQDGDKDGLLIFCKHRPIHWSVRPSSRPADSQKFPSVRN